MTKHPSQRPADAAQDNWVDLYAPAPMRPYLRLMRADRPVGVWLLLWPCWWAIALAAGCQSCGYAHESIAKMLALFAVGAFAMRSAGCIVNDLWDRDIDAQVERTAGRPLASGAVGVRSALLLLALMCAIGLVVLLQLNGRTILLGFASVPLVLLYPLAKRVTWWPQLFLGLVFNWGALMGWSAMKGGWPGWPSVLLYLGCIAWTIGYDTIYAHQDKEDDALVGVKSSALRLGDSSRVVIALLYSTAIALWFAAGWRANLGPLFYAGLAGAALHFAWQVKRLDINEPTMCLRLFKSNIHFGWIVFLAIALGSHIIIR
jgi:4-hydroxybenzoate polyprenyltransferase